MLDEIKSQEDINGTDKTDLDKSEVKLELGKYRHFKGKEYEALYIARHSETLEEMVVYKALYAEQGIWVRPIKMFSEEVIRDGKAFKRFEKI